MKFSDIARGTRTDEEIQLPRFDGQPDDAPLIKARMRPLNGLEEERALSAARKRAVEQGLTEPKAGEPLFDIALMVETIVIAILDADSPAGERAPFFDGGAAQIRQFYGREAITLIYELHQHYQDRVAPTLKRLSPVEFIAGLDVLGGEDDEKALRFFMECSPVLRWTYARSTAVPQRNALLLKSTPGSASEKSSSPTKSDADLSGEPPTN